MTRRRRRSWQLSKQLRRMPRANGSLRERAKGWQHYPLHQQNSGSAVELGPLSCFPNNPPPRRASPAYHDPRWPLILRKLPISWPKFIQICMILKRVLHVLSYSQETVLCRFLCLHSPEPTKRIFKIYKVQSCVHKSTLCAALVSKGPPPRWALAWPSNARRSLWASMTPFECSQPDRGTP